MSLTKETTVDQITVNENGVILYRETTRIKENGNIIGQSYHRTSLYPGQDLTGQPDNVKLIANAAWTSEVVASYEEVQARLDAEQAARNAQ